MDSKHTPWVVALTGSVMTGLVAIILFGAGRMMEGLFASFLGIASAVLALVFLRSTIRPDDDE